jgi:penicillin G amidase
MKPAPGHVVALAAALAGCGSSVSVNPVKLAGCPPSVAAATDGRCFEPPSAQAKLTGLDAEVDVLRDRYGWAHIYASSAGDAFRAEGWMMATDRMPELELLRRVAEGRTAELFGAVDPSTIDDDIVYRTIGLERIAEKQYASLDPSGRERRVLDAFADGVSQWIAAAKSGKVALPEAASGLNASDLTPWTGVDSLSILRLQAWIQSESLDRDLDLEQIVDGFHAVFRAGASKPELSARAGILEDVLRFAPVDPTTVLPDLPGLGAPGPASAPQPSSSAPVPPALLASASPFVRALDDSFVLVGAKRGDAGSSAWALSGVRTATGHALLANAPDLRLSSPSFFWPVHLDVEDASEPAEDLHLAGMALPGVPGVLLGFDSNLAWGATAAGYDVTDVYRETLTPDATAVRFQGRDVRLQNIDEKIAIRGGAPYDYTVHVVPEHGPILPAIGSDHRAEPLDSANGALSVRWTGFEPSDDFGALVGLWRAQDVDEARGALNGWQVGAENWVLADARGHVVYTSHARVPVRAPAALDWDAQSYTGRLPCLVLPGDGTAEWTGDVDDRFLPQVEDPGSGYVASANNDPLGTTLDNNPVGERWADGSTAYLSCFYDLGLRAGRIQDLIESQKLRHVTLDDLASWQGDARSALGALLTPRLLLSLKFAEEERAEPGSYPELASVVTTPRYQNADVNDIFHTLQDWGDKDDYQTDTGLDPDTGKPVSNASELNAAQATLIFNAWLTRLMDRVFADEFRLVNVHNAIFDSRSGLIAELGARALVRLWSSDPSSLATYDSSEADSVLWDNLETPAFETRNQDVVLALLDAIDDLNKTFGTDRSAWLWGKAHTVTLASGVPSWSFDVPAKSNAHFAHGFPRHGDQFVVDASDYDLARAAGQPLDFSQDSGAAERFVVDLDPSGPRAFDALPGGATGDSASPHFSDELELWRRNQNHAIPFSASDVIQASERAEGGEHIVLLP